jgi:hypothetical protein
MRVMMEVPTMLDRKAHVYESYRLSHPDVNVLALSGS